MIRLTASNIRTLCECPRKFRLSVIEKIKPAEEDEKFAHGSAWHRAFELDALEPPHDEPFNEIQDAYKAAALRGLYEAYKTYWAGMAPELIVEKCEIPFRLDVGANLDVSGRIDGSADYGGHRVVVERKLTSQNIDGDSGFWSILAGTPQLWIYKMAAAAEGSDFKALLYDAAKRPTIRPSKLDKKQKKVLFAQFTYCGGSFDPSVLTEVEATGRETPSMFSAASGRNSAGRAYEVFCPARNPAKSRRTARDNRPAQANRQSCGIYGQERGILS